MSVTVSSANSPYYLSSGAEYGDIVINGCSIVIQSGGAAAFLGNNVNPIYSASILVLSRVTGRVG